MEKDKLLKGSNVHRDSDGEFVSPYIPTPETERRMLPKTDDNEDDANVDMGNLNMSSNLTENSFTTSRKSEDIK